MAANFVEGVAAAIALKLACSIDDVLWLSAFMTPHHNRFQSVVTYTSICLLQTCLAYFLSQFGDVAVGFLLGHDDKHRISTNRVLTLLSGTALFLYAIVLGMEYYKESYCNYASVTKFRSSSSIVDDCEDPPGNDLQCESYCATMKEEAEAGEDKLENNEARHSVEMVVTSSDFDAISNELGHLPHDLVHVDMEDSALKDDAGDNYNAEKEGDSDHKSSKSLAIIAFLGSLDDLSLFVPMLIGKAFGIAQLVVGSFLTTIIIAMICIFVTQCQLVADVLKRIPLVAIVAVFSTFLLTKGIFFMD